MTGITRSSFHIFQKLVFFKNNLVSLGCESGLVRCVPVSVPFSDLPKSWGGGGSVTGTQLVPTGHSRSVHMYLRGHARPISARVCVICIHIDIGGSMGLSVLCAATRVSVCNNVPMGKDHFRGAPDLC